LVIAPADLASSSSSFGRGPAGSMVVRVMHEEAAATAGSYVVSAGPRRHGDGSRDDFKCYKSRQTPFDRLQVSLQDTIATSLADVVRPDRFCNPVDHDGEGIHDPRGRMNCYRLREARVPEQIVMVDNDLGEQELIIRRADTLCLPATLDGEASPLNHDPMKCYKAKRSPSTPKTPRDERILSDSFETKLYRAVRPLLYCNPVDRDGASIKDPEHHLTCYRIKEARAQEPFQPVSIDVVDAFVTQQLLPKRRVDTSLSRLFCLSSKRPDQTP
jgi:hypothetical protein